MEGDVGAVPRSEFRMDLADRVVNVGFDFVDLVCNLNVPSLAGGAGLVSGVGSTGTLTEVRRGTGGLAFEGLGTTGGVGAGELVSVYVMV